MIPKIGQRSAGFIKPKELKNLFLLGIFLIVPKGKRFKGGGSFADAYYFVDDLELREMQSIGNLVEADVCNMALDFSDIDYLIGETEVYEEIKASLDSYLQYIKIFKVNSIKIVGHANDTELDFENEIIAATRADYVREYLIENGVDELLIESIGVANTEPRELEEGDIEELGSNARVQIIIE